MAAFAAIDDYLQNPRDSPAYKVLSIFDSAFFVLFWHILAFRSNHFDSIWHIRSVLLASLSALSY
jgi:hypothetical protein